MFFSAVFALSAVGIACRRRHDAQTHRRPARTSRRSRRRGSKDASPDRTANGSPATTSSPSCRRSAPSRCPGRRTSGCRSSSPPARTTADRRSAQRSRNGGTQARVGANPAAQAGTCARSPSPTTATSTAPVVFAGYGIVVPDSQGFGYDSYATLDVKDKIVARAALLPGGRGARRRAASSRATPTCATRRWPRGSTARRR